MHAPSPAPVSNSLGGSLNSTPSIPSRSSLGFFSFLWTVQWQVSPLFSRQHLQRQIRQLFVQFRERAVCAFIHMFFSPVDWLFFASFLGLLVFRVENKVHLRTNSIWDELVAHEKEYKNPFFKHVAGTVTVNASMKKLNLWEDFWFRADDELRPRVDLQSLPIQLNYIETERPPTPQPTDSPPTFSEIQVTQPSPSRISRQLPRWIPDEFSTNCQKCQGMFTMFRRKVTFLSHCSSFNWLNLASFLSLPLCVCACSTTVECVVESSVETALKGALQFHT
jgi:hypothetical protein